MSTVHLKSCLKPCSRYDPCYTAAICSVKLSCLATALQHSDLEAMAPKASKGTKKSSGKGAMPPPEVRVCFRRKNLMALKPIFLFTCPSGDQPEDCSIVSEECSLMTKAINDVTGTPNLPITDYEWRVGIWCRLIQQYGEVAADLMGLKGYEIKRGLVNVPEKDLSLIHI